MTDLPITHGAARRRGRALGLILFAAIVTTFTAVCSVEIIIQAWAKPEASRPPGPGVGLPESR